MYNPQKKPVAELFYQLQQPPFGVKMGVLPILFTGPLMAHDTEVAA